jgi:hypothetical protein
VESTEPYILSNQACRIAKPTPLPLCPLCGGVLFPLVGMVRCSRCHFVMCEACGGFTDNPDQP